jgi:hypothetical protein
MRSVLAAGGADRVQQKRGPTAAPGTAHVPVSRSQQYPKPFGESPGIWAARMYG